MEGAPVETKVTIEDFRKLQFRVGKVVSAENHPNADRLLVLKVDLGTETRQLVAGIRRSYEAQALVGRNVIVFANLQPAMLRGVESNGMVLASTGPDAISILTVDKDVPPGSPVS